MDSVEVSQDLSPAQDRATVNLTVSLPRELYDFLTKTLKQGEGYFSYVFLDALWADLDSGLFGWDKADEMKKLIQEAQEQIPKGNWYR